MFHQEELHKTANQKAFATKKNILATNSMQYGKEQLVTESNSFRKFTRKRKYAVITFSYKSAEMDIKPLPQILPTNPESQIAQSSITPQNKSKHMKETETRKRLEVIVLSDDEIEENPKLKMKKPKVEVIVFF
ncbi:hypothetical protein BC833DRAFT_625351 [Globomyces pollinis-pini]|nr:hypothetical protein BC833DRAFT_625351 [Globomyces pollinis-pini]